MRNTLLFGISLIFLFGCAPNPEQDLDVEEADLVITRKTPDIDYRSDSVYAIFDQVLELKTDTVVLSDTDFDRQVIQEVKDQMANYGYVEAVDSLGNPDTTNPALDVAIMLVKFTQTNAGAVSGSYWGGYPGYWNPWYTGYPGAGWYYPGYTYVYSYQTGSLIISMFDWSKRDELTQIPIWEGGISGILESNSSNNVNRALWGIGQAFLQSPYLNQN